MSFRRRHRILSAGKSPSVMAMKRTYSRTILNGGVTQDFSANVENIREISRKLGYNILKTPINRNRLPFPEDLSNTIWTKQAITITSNSNLNPFEVNRSYYIEETNVNNLHYLGQDTANVTSGITYTSSWYVKKAQDSWVQLILRGLSFGTDVWVNFNFDTGLFGNSGSLGSWTATSVSNGYWKLTLNGVAIATGDNGAGVIIGTNNTNSVRALSYLGVTGHRIADIAGIQFEEGSVATTFSPYAPENTNANFLYVPSSYGESKNFAQVQNKRNLVPWSEDLTNALWVRSNIIVSTNTILNPFNINNSYYIVENTANGTHFISENTSSIIIGATYTTSFYVTKAQDTWCQFGLGNTGFDINTWKNFNFDTGTFGNGGASGIWTVKTLSNNYYLITVTTNAVLTALGTPFVGGANNTDIVNRLPAYTGTSRQFCNVAAIQLETGAYATPYQKTVAVGDGIVDFNFTRATTATVTNKLGIIEDSCYNLLQRSEEFDNAYWIKGNSTVTANTVVSPYNTLTADKLIANTTNAGHQVATIYGAVPISTFTFSCYMKKSEYSRGVLRISDGTTVQSSAFDLINNTASTPVPASIFVSSSAKIESVGNDWYRCSVTTTSNARYTLQVQISMQDNSAASSFIGDNVSGVYIWGAQLVQDSTPRPYLRTTNRLNVPRLDYSRGLGKPELLIERAATNLMLQSNDFSNGAWVVQAPVVSRVANATISPDGAMGGTKITENTSSGSQRIFQSKTSQTGTLTFSVYAKKAERDFVKVDIAELSLGDFVSAIFDLNTGTISTPVFSVGTSTAISANIVSVGNGWYRCIVTGTIASGNASGVANIRSTNSAANYAGVAGNGIYLWGGQFEVGTIATTYVPATTAVAPRNAETSYVDLFNNSLLNSSNWTLFWEGYLYDGQASLASLCLSDTNTASTNTNQIGWTGNIQPFYNVANTRTNGYFISSNNSFNRFVIQYNNGIATFWVNGVSILNSSVAVFGYRYLVLNSGGSTFANDKIALFSRTLTNTECISLTDTGGAGVPNLNTSIVAYYGFNNNLVDTVNSNNGTAIGSVLFAGAKPGLGTASLAGSIGYISIPQSTNLDFSNITSDLPFSIAFWWQKNDSTTRMVINKTDGTSSGAQWQIIQTTSGIKITLHSNFTTDYISKIPSSTIISNGVWYHSTITYNGLGLSGLKMYHNGVLVATTDENIGVYTKMPIKSQIARIGDDYAGAYNSPVGVDELAIWKNRELSSIDISYLYNAGSGRVYPF